MTDLRAAVEGLEQHAPCVSMDTGATLDRAAVLALIPEGAVLVTEEGLARALCVTRPPTVDQEWIADWPPDNECRAIAAAILRHLREAP